MAAVEKGRHLHAKVFKDSEKVEDFKLDDLIKMQRYALHLEANAMVVNDLAEQTFTYFVLGEDYDGGAETISREQFEKIVAERELAPA